MENRHKPGRPAGRAPKPAPSAPKVEATTLWDFPSRSYGEGKQGRDAYAGATPSYVIWNLLTRYTAPGELVVDPMAGSGTTLDVAADLGREAMGFDIHPTRPDIARADARAIPLAAGKADFVFVDPPYSTHIHYSDDPNCIGKLDAAGPEYYDAMAGVVAEIDRVLAPGRHMGLYVSDSFVKGKGFYPIGFGLFSLLAQRLEPVDIISVVRRNKTLEMGNYRRAAEEGNFFLRGFNYLFIMRKPETRPEPARRRSGKRPGKGGGRRQKS